MRPVVDPDKQWRIDTAHFLKGVLLQRRKWMALSAGSDHDHCTACWSKFANWDGPDIQHEGYTTCDGHELGPGYYWVCVQCFADLKDDMEWRLAPSDAPNPPTP